VFPPLKPLAFCYFFVTLIISSLTHSFLSFYAEQERAAPEADRRRLERETGNTHFLTLTHIHIHAHTHTFKHVDRLSRSVPPQRRIVVVWSERPKRRLATTRAASKARLESA
jgi:hypothetical protein